VPKRYTPEVAINLVMERGFSPIGPFPGAKGRWKAKHIDCGGTVFITLNSVRNPRKKVGVCANCATNAPTSEADALSIMKKAGLKPLVRFPGYDKPWKSIPRQ
jgi:hypothetical protein